MEDRKVYLKVSYEYKGLEFTEIMGVEEYQNLLEYADIKNIEKVKTFVK